MDDGWHDANDAHSFVECWKRESLIKKDEWKKRAQWANVGEKKNEEGKIVVIAVGVYERRQNTNYT